ncbi:MULTISPECIES: translocation/assembly module TamB [unclassified Sphingomonas]|uniref:translocation/assembly module TamB domain-containing protein n=1 Tax=unclassified Sphingomonas TaxID=196159 RepID=UPI002269EDE3|nr:MULTISPECIES: translocation/assembly module TamB [unclassified Sphingomonas]
MVWVRRIGIAIGVLLAVFAAALLGVDTDIGHRVVADRIGTVRTATGLRFAVGRIDGSLYSNTRIRDLRVYDTRGLVFTAPNVALDWSPWRWFANTLAIRRLAVPSATLLRTPVTRPTRRNGPILPGFDIRIDRLAIDRLTLAAPVLGTARTAALHARADIRSGRALVALNGTVAGSDRLAIGVDVAPDADRFAIAVHGAGARGGVLARMLGAKTGVAIDLGGHGRWHAWNGRATLSGGAERLAALTLAAQSGRYTLSGMVAPERLTHGILRSLTVPRVLVNGSATFADRRLAGTLTLRSPSLLAEASGAVDLGANAFRDLHVRARLLRARALFPNMTGNDIRLRATLDGGFDSAAFAYRLDADRFAFDDTGFEDVHAGGHGHLSAAPVAVPVRIAAARVTGVGSVAGGILRNLTLSGILHVTPETVSGSDLALVSDKLKGRFVLTVDLDSGVYAVGIAGGLGRYLIPGLGIVDIASTFRAVPGPGNHGTRLIGKGTADVRRLDDAFFASLMGGLPHVTADLERTPDTVLHLSNIVLTAPLLRIVGAGYRRRDGSVHFEGVGRHATYGPLTLKLDGPIGKPVIDLAFASPDATLGLNGVRAHLDPTPQGFAFTASGGAHTGPFVARGAILLPSGPGASAIRVDAIDTAGAHASGLLAIVAGGLDGRLAVTGAATGALTFRPVGTIQRIGVALDGRAVRYGGAVLRQGHVEADLLLDPAGTRIDASASGQGLRRGALNLSRFAIAAHLKGGTGEVRGSIAGTRGRPFAIQAIAQMTPTRASVAAQGTLDGRPIALTAPAILTREDDGWRLATTRLAFAGGEATIAGRFGGSHGAIDATMTRMPLAILDIGYPGLGLLGNASGSLSVVTGPGPTTGKIAVTVRGLSRAGLVLSSRPIDLGLAGMLSADTLGARAVLASGGKTIGRAQARLALAPGGDVATRIASAGLFAQLRYAGPADALWRLGGVELFDLSGPIAVAADATGRVDAPAIRGVVQATGARLESGTTGTVFTNVQASGRFGGAGLVIDRFAGDAGKGGRVTGGGRFDFSAAHGVGLDLALKADHAAMIARDDIAATVTGTLTFKSDGSGGTIGGDVTLDRSRYRLGQATAASAVPQLNIREINLPEGGEEAEAPARPWTLAVHAHAPGQVRVLGLGLDSEWSADLAIAGAPDDPAITGRATLIRGDYDFAGRKFTLDRGVIRFAGELPANPALDITANADSTGLNAQIRVTGVALKPEIGFTSVPALPQDELLSRLLFGTSITNLSAPEALQLAAAVAALQNGGRGGLNPINAVRRAAGLDRLRILPADPQTGQGTSIAAGKYVTRRFYAEIVTDGQGYSATQAEFQVTRWLSLLSSISTLGRQSGNVRVSKDY